MPIPFKPSSPTPSTEKKHLSKNPSFMIHLVFSQDAVTVRYTWDFFIMLVVFPFFLSGTIMAKDSNSFLDALFGCPIIHLIFVVIIIYSLFKMRNFPVFDILNGMFYPQGRHHAETAVSLKDIDHLQFIEIETIKNSCYYSKSYYELNVVMKNGNRFNVIAQGERLYFIKDAKQLAASLALPLKDEIGEPYIDLPGKFKGPLVHGGSYYQSMHLIFRQDSITVRMTWKRHLRYMVLMVIGIGIFCFGLYSREDIIYVLGVLLAMIGLLNVLGQMLKRTFPLFDIVEGMFYPKGFTRDGSAFSLSQLDHLEILREHVIEGGRNKNEHDAYELNAVLKDGSRYNIMDHGDKKRMLEDAHELAERLSLPLVDALSGLPIT